MDRRAGDSFLAVTWFAAQYVICYAPDRFWTRDTYADADDSYNVARDGWWDPDINDKHTKPVMTSRESITDVFSSRRILYGRDAV